MANSRAKVRMVKTKAGAVALKSRELDGMSKHEPKRSSFLDCLSNTLGSFPKMGPKDADKTAQRSLGIQQNPSAFHTFVSQHCQWRLPAKDRWAPEFTLKLDPSSFCGRIILFENFEMRMPSNS